MLTLPVHHPLIPTKQPPASPGSRCTTDSYTVGGICYWHGGGERESGVCFDAIKKLAHLIVNEKNWTLSVADVKRQEVDFYCSSAVGFKMNSLGRRPEGAQQRSWRSWMIKQLLFTDTINSRMVDTLALREGHPVIPTAAAIPAKSYWRSTETNSHYYGRTAQKHNCIVLNLVFTDKEWHFGGSRICFIRFYHLVRDTRYYIRDSKSRVSAKKQREMALLESKWPQETKSNCKIMRENSKKYWSLIKERQS